MSPDNTETRNDDSTPGDDLSGSDRPSSIELPAAPSFYDSNSDSTKAFESPDFDAPFVQPELAEQLGAYQLLEVVGKGGAGIVYRAIETSTGKTVAVKVIRPEMLASGQAAKRFQKEARLHSEIDSPYVTRHLEVAQQNGIFYSVCEFIDGVSLREIVEEFVNLPVRDSLIVVRDLLRGLAALHAKGVVHRDVKPENLMVVFNRSESGDFDFDSFVHGKLTDFGLARHVDQTQSLAMTRQQTILGTPLYMAPEQYTESRSADARADVYSAGATLFHLLVGQPPFDGDNVVELATMHRTEKPQSVKSLRLDVSEALSNIVAKSLEKEPTLRYQDAAAMLADVEQILNGGPISIRPWPATPTTDPAQVRRYRFEFELAADVKQLWPLVADSDRFNRALGLPAPSYTFSRSHPDQTTGLSQQQIHAEASFNGMKIRWQEHPFEWIFQRQMSILREFDAGPFQWFTSTIELAPLANNRTRLTHGIQVAPRGWLGKIMVPIQFGLMTRRSLKRVYQRMVEIATDASSPYICEAPLGRPVHLNRRQRERLEQQTLLLGKQTGRFPLADKLANYLRTVADPAAARIRPVPLSNNLDCSVDEAIELCLHAVGLGILKMTWDILCPVCRIASANEATLQSISSHANCDYCDKTFEVDLSRSVEVVFRAHPEIRVLDTKVYCIGGPYHSPHVIAQNRLQPGQQVEIGTSLNPGHYEIRSPQLEQTAMLNVATENTPSPDRVAISLGPDNNLQDAVDIAQGAVCICLENSCSAELLTRLETRSARDDAITAAWICQRPLFKEQFPEQIVQAKQLIERTHIYLLLIKNSDANKVLDTIGDIRMRSAWDRIQAVLKNGLGQECDVLDVTSEHVLVGYPTLETLRDRLIELYNAFPEDSPFELNSLAVAINAGEVMSGNQDNQPRFFGETVRQTSKLLDDARAGQLVMAQELQSQVDWLSGGTSDKFRLGVATTDGEQRAEESTESFANYWINSSTN